MAEAVTSYATKRRHAVVTGANKGIGLEICKQLASHGITVVLTARDEKRGIDALEKLKGYCGLSDDDVIFHQLDVADPASVAPLAEFLKTKFGKLDILVNNAGILGAVVEEEGFITLEANNYMTEGIKWDEMATETYELAEQCLQTNYYGAKRLIEALIPLLQLSDSPTIVNVSSSMGRLKYLPNEWAKEILNDAQNLSKERVDVVLNKYLKDFKEGLVQAENWPPLMSSYMLSKAAMNAYTRILAKNFPTFCVNALCPGFVKTDIVLNTGRLTAEEGAESAVKLALLPNGGPSGLFFFRGDVSSFE